jgi:hypothetical protein
MAHGHPIRGNARRQSCWFGTDGLANPHNEATTGRPAFTPLCEEGRIRKEIIPKTLFPGVRHGGLILLSWLPLVIGVNRSSTLSHFLVAWGGSVDGCTATINTSGFAQLAARERMFLICRVSDASVDLLEDEKIAISRPFQITGGVVTVNINYDPNSGIKRMAAPGSQTWVHIVLLPKDEDGSRIRKLADVEKVGGQILLEGGKLKP